MTTKPTFSAVRDIFFFQAPTAAYRPVQTLEEFETVKYSSDSHSKVWFRPDADPYLEGPPRSHSYYAPPTGAQFTRTTYVVDQWPLEVFASSHHFLVLVGNTAAVSDLKQIEQIAVRLFMVYNLNTWNLTCVERLENDDVRFASPWRSSSDNVFHGGVMAGQLYFELAKSPGKLHPPVSRTMNYALDEFIPRLRDAPTAEDE